MFKNFYNAPKALKCFNKFRKLSKNQKLSKFQNNDDHVQALHKTFWEKIAKCVKISGLIL